MIKYLFFLYLSASTAFAALKAEISPKTITEGERADLILSSETPLSGSPDFSPLTEDFSLGGYGSVQRTAILNGKRTTLYQYSVSLMPLKTGTLEIPPLTWDTEISQPVTLVVTEVGSTLPQSEEDLFLKATLSQESVYPKQQVIYTAAVYDRVGLISGGFVPPSAPDTEVGTLGEPQTYTKEMNGKTYQVFEQKFVLFPSKSGKINLTPALFQGFIYQKEPASSRSSFFGFPDEFVFGSTRNQKEIVLKADSVDLFVLEKPENLSEKWWLPSTAVSVEQVWTPTENTLKQGETLTRTIRLQARGILASSFPNLSMKDGVGYKVYPAEPKTSLSYDSSGLIATWERDFVIMPTEDGEVQIPDLSFSWFNTQKKEETTTLILGKILNVKPNSVFQQEASPVVQEAVKEIQQETLSCEPCSVNFLQKENNVLFFIGGFFCGWILILAFLFIFFLIKRHKKKIPDLYPF